MALPWELAGPLRTPRLVLRRATDADVDAVHAYQALPEVARWLYWEPRDRAATAASLARMARSTSLAHDGDGLGLVMERADDGTVVGEAHLILRSAAHRQAEIGYIVDPRHAGQGFATEAGRELLRVAFEELGAHRAIARLEARNVASARVAERLGMRREATLVENEHVKGEWQSEAIYALLAREWRAAAG